MQIFSHSINEYCNKLEQLFAKEMTVVAEEIAQPVAAPSSQKAWIEKARSTIANLQGEKKIQAFFNFVPQVHSPICWPVVMLIHSHVPSSTTLSLRVNSWINYIRICE